MGFFEVMRTVGNVYNAGRTYYKAMKQVEPVLNFVDRQVERQDIKSMEKEVDKANTQIRELEEILLERKMLGQDASTDRDA